MDHANNPDPVDPRLTWLYRISGSAALLTGIILLISLISLILAVLQPGSLNSWLSLLQNNWLIVILKLLAGFGGAQGDLLHILNYLDIAILALVCMTYLGLYAALRSTAKFWSMIAAIQPFLGVALFIATKTAGRSTVMGAGLVISLVMLRSSLFKKLTAVLGILASVLLLAGDIAVGVASPSTLLAALFGIGYVLMMTWFFLVARSLFQLGLGVSKGRL